MFRPATNEKTLLFLSKLSGWQNKMTWWNYRLYYHRERKEKHWWLFERKSNLLLLCTIKSFHILLTTDFNVNFILWRCPTNSAVWSRRNATLETRRALIRELPWSPMITQEELQRSTTQVKKTVTKCVCDHSRIHIWWHLHDKVKPFGYDPKSTVWFCKAQHLLK